LNAQDAEIIRLMSGKYKREALTSLRHSFCAAQNVDTHSGNTAKTSSTL
jgi:hypothetical protein